MGRLLDRIGTPDNPLQGISLDGQLSPALATARNPVAAVDKPEDVGFWTPGAWGPAEELAVGAFTDVGRSPAGSRDPAVAQAARAVAFAGGVGRSFGPLGRDGKPAYAPMAAYPQTTDAFPKRLAGFAAMLSAGLPIRCASISAPGAYDTHADQAKSLGRNLQLTCDSLLAFQRDLEARGLADRVLTLVWSTLRAGRAVIQLANRGEDPHDLRLARVRIPETLPGEVGEWSGRLRRGRYKLYCSLPGHAKAGVRAYIRVR